MRISTCAVFPPALLLLCPTPLSNAAGVIPDLDLEVARLAVLLDVDVDGEMGIDVAHLVLEALCHADYQVVDERANCAEGSDVLARAVVDLDVDDVLLGQGEVDGQMAQALGELACIPALDHPLRLACLLLAPVMSYLGDPRQ